MLNFKPERHQTDGLQEEYSLATGTTTPGEDPVRQEFKEEVDINNILTRFGVSAAFSGQPMYGEVDFTIGLQEAISAVDQAADAHRRMPKEIKDLYPTWQSMLNAIQSGDLRRATLEEIAAAEASEKEDKKTKSEPPSN